MDEASLVEAVPDLVLAGWGRQLTSARPMGGGMNSATALVEIDEERFVAKWVRTSSASALAFGCDVARRLARHGIDSGEPVPTPDGQLSVATADGAIALLRFVPGEPLIGDIIRDQRDIAITLARVHAVEADTRPATFMEQETAALVHDVEPWIRPAVSHVLEAYGRLPELTWGLLNADPAPEAFRRDQESGAVGLIDWTAAARGPVLYDVASALMYLGGRAKADAFWDAYRGHSPAPPDELDEHIETFTRLRGAVQAAYFSMRVATADPTGISHQDENWKGLRDAERMLEAAGVLPLGCWRDGLDGYPSLAHSRPVREE